MNLGSLIAQFQWDHRDEPQVAKACELALREVESGLLVLARHGHHFSLEEGHRARPEWPKMFYHYHKGAKLVFCEQDLKELGPGWKDSPLNAEIWEGIQVQFLGRGGIKRKDEPLVVLNGHEVQDLSPDHEATKREFLNRDME